MTDESTIDDQIRRVVEAGNCSGCGACVLLDAGLSMRLDDAGFARPQRVSRQSASVFNPAFNRVCPGARVEAQTPVGSTRHATMGSFVEAHQGWSIDGEFRHMGSSGGVLSALASWLISSGRVATVVGAAADVGIPTRTVSVEIKTRRDALEAAGSRYGPVANATLARIGDENSAFIGKPCEVSAVRALARTRGAEPPLLLSFYCAGTPSQSATDDLVRDLAEGQDVRAMWYRGRGWPGYFTVVREDGTEGALSYDESWGKALGPSAQWRCKLCVDGIGESADLVAADYWRTDDRGYPLFEEGEGVSAILARTKRGADILADAVADGILHVEPLDVDDLAAVQPFQVTRRSTLWGRLLGARLAGRATPSYRGFKLWRFALRQPLRQLRTARGTFRRLKGPGR
ncbi:Coenzyme F420 hydrogenase/dehydrogenase, beta subunit C-terminal domain [Micropruina sonneratiae]|uniref:Coenzyme F420 hydrogenase/dehydrogenase, beta subunit C-terminal domain n=1 Tax=Micropruina sonneratiae TaxID=2986940 RepID=UPI002227FC57|nr:Coenzyme F420 hydrogenase/dehydrogenase, beta subunit C-terminal domain [Micropruina sp. KQZ13P-5]MCW3158744.1 Coenzyme F420 hydrogenase/dehydrogenase, beta subunit C-terminal domain [Micropruina sp. KQZ13P-5]